MTSVQPGSKFLRQGRWVVLALLFFCCWIIRAEDVSFIWKMDSAVVGRAVAGNGHEPYDVRMPDIVKLPDNTWRMYYGATLSLNPPPGTAVEAIRSAVSSDGLTWTVETGMRLIGDADGDGGADTIPANERYVAGPRVVRLGDGRYRLYYQASSTNTGAPDFRVKSAISNDGLTFAREGTRVDINYPNGGPGQFALAGHCMVLRFADNDFRMFISGNYDGKTSSAASDLLVGTSTDGLTFGNWKVLYANCHDAFILPVAGGAYRMFFGYLLERMRSATSADGKTWPAYEQTSGTIVLKSNGEEITEASVPEVPADRALLQLPSGEIVLYYPIGGASGINMTVFRQQPPQINSALSASATAGVPFSYIITALGNDGASYSAAPLPTGVSLAGNVLTGTVAQAGSYAIALGATNIGGADSKTLVLTVNPMTTTSDADGDGFPDELETALGTNPADATSTPFGGAAAGTPLELVIGKMQIKLDFAKANNDRINIQGTLPVANGFGFANQVVVLDVGGVIKSFTLNGKGNSPSGANDSVKINKPKGGVAKYIVKFNKGSFAANLADEGLVGTADAKSASKEVTVVALFNNTLLRTTKTLSYTAKANKGGLAK